MLSGGSTETKPANSGPTLASETARYKRTKKALAKARFPSAEQFQTLFLQQLRTAYTAQKLPLPNPPILDIFCQAAAEAYQREIPNSLPALVDPYLMRTDRSNEWNDYSSEIHVVENKLNFQSQWIQALLNVLIPGFVKFSQYFPDMSLPQNATDAIFSVVQTPASISDMETLLSLVTQTEMTAETLKYEIFQSFHPLDHRAYSTPNWSQLRQNHPFRKYAQPLFTVLSKSSPPFEIPDKFRFDGVWIVAPPEFREDHLHFSTPSTRPEACCSRRVLCLCHGQPERVDTRHRAP